MKKILSLSVAALLSLNVMAAELTQDEHEKMRHKSPEYSMHTENLFPLEVNEIYEGTPLSKFTYLGEDWMLASDIENTKYYIQIDPIYNVISRVRIVYPFDEVRTGKELKYLESLYGQITDTGAKFMMVEDDSLRVRISTDFNNLGSDYNQLYTIIEFIELNTSKKRKESINKIYYEEEMIRR